MGKKVTELAVAQQNGEMLNYVNMKKFKETKKCFRFYVDGCKVVIYKNKIVGYSIKRG